MEQTFFLDALWYIDQGFETCPRLEESTSQEETTRDIAFTQTSRETWAAFESEISFPVSMTPLFQEMEVDTIVTMASKPKTTTEMDFSQTLQKAIPPRPVRIVCVLTLGTKDLNPLAYQQRKMQREADLNFPAFLKGGRAKIRIVSSFLGETDANEKKNSLEARLNSTSLSDILVEHERSATSKRSITRELSAYPQKRTHLTEMPVKTIDASSCSDNELRSSAGIEKQVKTGRTKKLSRLKRKHYGTTKVFLEKAGTAAPENTRKPKTKSGRTESPKSIDTAGWRNISGFKMSKHRSTV